MTRVQKSRSLGLWCGLKPIMDWHIIPFDKKSRSFQVKLTLPKVKSGMMGS
ncbi:hypothetical protein GO986_05540 [Deinococcus sp. HMF7620]|uniref:Uncharacterized protein n=1 Tax=Deinococcus arboris TaxID=2682977 RepID=A0A7C9M7D4_9DEIO|nr:hypothetical protein [Deinococcus arboris]MVN86223.1 hypothetical protein [Deinococcus arboris]